MTRWDNKRAGIVLWSAPPGPRCARCDMAGAGGHSGICSRCLRAADADLAEKRGILMPQTSVDDMLSAIA